MSKRLSARFHTLPFSSATLLLFALLLTSCTTTQTATSPSTPADLTKLERPIPYPIDVPDAFKAAIEAGTRTEKGRPGANYWTNSASYSIKTSLDPAQKTVTGSARIVYTNNSPDELPVLLMELAQNLHKAGTIKFENVEVTGGVQLTSVKVDGVPMSPTTMRARYMENASGYVEDATRLILFIDEPVAPGASATIDVEWSFTVPQAGASGRMGYSRDNLFYIAYWYPQMSVYDDVYGWMEDPFTGNAEFYHDFSDYELEITAPAGWVVMATGEFLNPEQTLSATTLERYRAAGASDVPVVIVDEGEFAAATRSGDSDGLLTWKFRAERVRDVAFSATKESIWHGTRASVGDLDGDGAEDFSRIHTFYRSSAPLWKDQVIYAKHSIEFLSRYTGTPYPWPHMTSIEGEDIIGGGMEFPMMTIIGPYTTRGPKALYSVTAHELAHMWFPMLVSTNERRYSWMDEGTTDFNTHAAELDFYPGEYDNNNVFAFYTQIAGTDLEGPMMRWSDYHYPGPAFGVASYVKPASVLLALRAVIGEDAFMIAFQEYQKRWAYKHPYPWDLFNTFEDVSGQDLDWFWRSWYYETWVLDHAVASVRNEEGRAVITIRDEGNVVMPVDLRIGFENGNSVSARISHTVWLGGKRSSVYTVDTASPVVHVEIDPGLTVPDVDRANNLWMSDGGQ